jgi:hypothetical protein
MPLPLMHSPASNPKRDAILLFFRRSPDIGQITNKFTIVNLFVTPAAA